MRANRPAPAAYISPLTGHVSWARKATSGATWPGAMGDEGSSVSAPGPAMRVMAAGAMRLTLMPCASLMVAMLRVKPMTPPLAVAYERFLGRPKTPDDVVMTTRP